MVSTSWTQPYSNPQQPHSRVLRTSKRVRETVAEGGTSEQASRVAETLCPFNPDREVRPGSIYSQAFSHRRPPTCRAFVVYTDLERPRTGLPIHVQSRGERGSCFVQRWFLGRVQRVVPTVGGTFPQRDVSLLQALFLLRAPADLNPYQIVSF